MTYQKAIEKQKEYAKHGREAEIRQESDTLEYYLIPSDYFGPLKMRLPTGDWVIRAAPKTSGDE